MSDDSTSLIPIEPDSELMPPAAEQRIIIGYYECIEPLNGIEVGQYVRVTHLDFQTGDIHFVRRYGKRTMAQREFLRHFEYAPDGEARFNKEFEDLNRRVTTIGNEIVTLQQGLANVTIHADSAGVAGLDEIKDLVPVQGDRSLTGAKQTMAQVTAIVHTKRGELQKAQEELKALMAERQAAFEALVKPLEELVERMQEGIWTIKLYFGDEMEVVQIRAGKPAPVTTPITIRQLVLAMDEECAVAADQGGIDARTIEQFDQWLLESQAHVDQVIPEEKAIVALVPRWNPKDYKDPWLTAQIAQENRQTWLLIRNGEQLFRVAPDMLVGKSLLPRRDEFSGFFFTEQYNPQTRERERVPLMPGTREFMEAEKKADKRKRHYMRIALVIQGLLDHHVIFAPLPEPITVTKPDSFERGMIRIIEDAEMSLGDGRERFVEWQKRLNADLDVGMRVIGDFNGWDGFAGMQSNGRHRRLSPDTAERPASNVLYTLREKRDGGFAFLYERTGGWRDYERRASCVIKAHDDFILPFDLITVEEIDFYLRSRLDRANYVSMFPVLKAARRAKLEEQKAEAPFRELLAWEIAKRYEVDVETAAQAVPELVSWFKYKTKTHRPLVGDDEGKALRMIVDAYAMVAREAENRAKRQARGEFDQMLAQAQAEYPDLLLFAHRAETEYVALVPHNDEPIYVREIVMTPRGKREEQSWRIVDGRIKRWQILYTSERWEQWVINPSRSEHMTDPEIEALADDVRRAVVNAVDREQRRWSEEKRTPLEVLALTFDRDANEYHVYARTSVLSEPPPFLLAERPEPRRVTVYGVSWKRNAQRQIEIGGVHHSDNLEWPISARPWDAKQYRRSSMHGRTQRGRAEIILFIDEDAISRVQTNAQTLDAAIRTAKQMGNQVSTLRGRLSAQWEAREWAKLHDAFMADYGAAYNADDLWANHKKGLKNPPRFPFHTNVVLTLILSYFVERGISVEGRAWADVVALYRAERPEDTDAECIKPYDSYSRGREDRKLPTGMDDFTL